MENPRQRKRNELTLKDKVELINASAGKNDEQFSIGKTQVQAILKKNTEIISGQDENKEKGRNRLNVRSPFENLTTYCGSGSSVCDRRMYRYRGLDL